MIDPQSAAVVLSGGSIMVAIGKMLLGQTERRLADYIGSLDKRVGNIENVLMRREKS